jgi:hydrogenase maturation protease
MKSGDLIVGVGSPHGDDAVGWLAVERLAGKVAPSVRLVALRQPVELADHLEGCRRLWIVDGCRGSQPGTVHRLIWPDARIELATGYSSHGFGVAAALELTAALGRLPQQVVIFAIEAEDGRLREAGAGVSAEAESALAELEQRLIAELDDCHLEVSP